MVPPRLAETLGGPVQLMFDGLATAVVNVRAGRVIRSLGRKLD